MAWRTCRRCNGSGKHPTAPGEPCHACGGKGQISPRRPNSFLDPGEKKT